MRVYAIHAGTGNSPIVPRSLTNPVGQTDRIRRTAKAIADSLASVKNWLLSRFEQIPVSQVVANNLRVNRYRYEYQISVVDLERLVNEMLIQLGTIPDNYVNEQVIGAYEDGTAQAVDNLANITDDYTRNITQVLISDPWQRRSALISARVFEEMKGFEGQTGVDLARILRSAVQDGIGPIEVKDQIKARFDVADRRAETIARTEITGALRRGRWDEAQDARDKLGIKLKMLWVSALSPTTRLWHAQRHGNLYQIQDVREFYAVDGNAINCKCSQTEMLVDDDGNPVTPKLIDRMKKQKAAYFGNN